MSTQTPTTTEEQFATSTTETRGQSRRRGAPMMFSPSSTATMGQFDTEADEPQ